MPETKIDQSLDEIVSNQRGGASRGRGHGRQAPKSGRTGPSAGVKKNSKRGKAVTLVIPTGPSGGNNHEILVRSLPRDVSEDQIKEYFIKSVGSIKRVDIAYNPRGVSRGIAIISFKNADGPQKAVEALNGLLVDGSPMKIHLIVDPSRVTAIAPKGLSERIVAPKKQPKPVPGKKSEGASGTSTRGAKKDKKARNPRAAHKTAEELDSEMADYFENGANPDSATVVNGDEMVEEAI